MKGLSLHFYMSVIMIGKANSVTPKHRVFGVAFPLQEQKKREENEFNSIYLLIYSLLSRKNQQTLGVSDNKITKKNICCLEGYIYIVCCEARKLFWHINREDILPERRKKKHFKSDTDFSTVQYKHEKKKTFLL